MFFTERTMKKRELQPLNPDLVPGKEKLCYGIGGFMDGGAVALMSCVMLKYMTTWGIAPAIASTIMMVAKIWDAITDPLMGFISDNTRGKFGRRKPYMVVGGILVIVALTLLFMPVRKWGMSTGGSGISLNKVSFWLICVTAILYLVAMILHLVGIEAVIVSALQAVATAIMIIVVAILAWRYVKNKQTVWKILYIVCLLVVIVGIIIPLVI